MRARVLHRGILVVLVTGCASGETAETAVRELLAADVAFADAASRTDAITALSAMFADDVAMPIPGAGFAEGRDSVIAALRRAPDLATSHIEWQPVRGGVSADGQHGFTFGYMTQTRADNTTLPLKYLAYWIRRDDGWRVAVFKRGRAPAHPTAVDSMPPALPARMTAVSADGAAIERYRTSLDSAERAFSDHAQQVGLRAAFAQYGSADAINLGGPADTTFVVGSEAIGRAVSAGEPSSGSSVSWSPDRVIIASSGDFGVTLGTIRVNQPDSTGVQRTFPFFTIWRRESTNAPWRYIAE
jgi:ketosteroid isomerase-like protein